MLIHLFFIRPEIFKLVENQMESKFCLFSELSRTGLGEGQKSSKIPLDFLITWKMKFENLRADKE